MFNNLTDRSERILWRMLGLGSSLCAQSYAGGDIELVLTGVTVDAMLNGITQSAGAKVNGTCTVKLANFTEYGLTESDKGVDTFNIFQINPALSTVFFLSLATSDITISSLDDYYAVNLTVNTWLDPAGADAELDSTDAAALYYFHEMYIDSIIGAVASNEVNATLISVDAA